MAMSKESAIGWILVGFGFGMEVVFKALGIDGDAETIFKAMLSLGFGLIGLKGVSDVLKAKPPIDPGVQ